MDAIDGSYCTYSAFGETGNSKLDPPYPDPKKGGYKGKLQCGKYKPTNVISISYGGQEPDLPMSYQRRQCNEFMKLGMQGVSVFVASGDSGVAGVAQGNDNGCIKQKLFNPVSRTGFASKPPIDTDIGLSSFMPLSDVSRRNDATLDRQRQPGRRDSHNPLPERRRL